MASEAAMLIFEMLYNAKGFNLLTIELFVAAMASNVGSPEFQRCCSNYGKVRRVSEVSLEVEMRQQRRATALRRSRWRM